MSTFIPPHDPKATAGTAGAGTNGQHEANGQAHGANGKPKPPPVPRIDKDQIRRFFRLICDPAVGCLEARIPDANMDRGLIGKHPHWQATYSGWFDDPDRLATELGRLNGISAYATVNPVDPSLLSLSDNRIVKVKTNTSDKDIASIVHWFIDIDPDRKSGISSTDAQLAAAVARRDQILADHPELAAAAFWGVSGNGAYIVARLIGYPNDVASNGLVAQATEILSARYSDPKVEIDTATKNPARIMAIAGTVKCKGSYRPERPWRMATIDSPEEHDQDRRPLDLAEWIGRQPQPERPEPEQQADRRRTNQREQGQAGRSRQWVLDRARKCIMGMRDSVEGNHGHDVLYAAACALIDGFGLTRAEAYPIFADWNAAKAKPPESEKQVNHKLDDAIKNHPNPSLELLNAEWDGARRNGQHQENGQADPREPDEPPLDVAAIKARVDNLIAKKQVTSLFEDEALLADLARLEVEHPREFTVIAMKLGETRGFPKRQFSSLLKEARFRARAKAASAAAPDDQGEDAGEPLCLPGQEDNPHRLARKFLHTRHLFWGEPTLRYWQGEFHDWRRGAFHPFPDKEVRGVLAGFAADEFQAIHSSEMMQWKMGKKQGDAPPPLIPVSTKLVGDVTQALSGLTLLKKSDHPRQPTWLCDDPPWPASEVLPTRNVLVHLPSYVEGRPCTKPLTPNFFTPFALDYDFDVTAPDPINWLTFLGTLPVEPGGAVQHQVWPDDPQSIATLQEWFGLNLVLDISYQKMLAMIGVKRSGKGTISRMLSRTVGASNVVNPKLMSLATNFGLAPLIGKPTAIITDARLSGRVDQSAIVENLLSISGEDDQTIDRKHKDAWTGKLPTRFTIISNELPRLSDASGTLPSRFILLRFTRSFYGNEDRELEQKLIPELPGILLWAIKGWDRLRRRGYFEQPTVGAELMDQLKDLASPIKGFIDERCILGPGNLATVKELFAAWREYCLEKNRASVGDEASFGRDMHAAIPDLKTTQPRNKEDRSRPRCYEGIRLRPKENRPSSPLANWLFGYLRRGPATQDATLRDAAACGFTNPKEVQVAAASLKLNRFYDENGYDCWEIDPTPF